jgi:hypothetical protein
VPPDDHTKLICTAALWINPLVALRSFFVCARKLAQKHTSIPAHRSLAVQLLSARGRRAPGPRASTASVDATPPRHSIRTLARAPRARPSGRTTRGRRGRWSLVCTDGAAAANCSARVVICECYNCDRYLFYTTRATQCIDYHCGIVTSRCCQHSEARSARKGTRDHPHHWREPVCRPCPTCNAISLPLKCWSWRKFAAVG